MPMSLLPQVTLDASRRLHRPPDREVFGTELVLARDEPGGSSGRGVLTFRAGSRGRARSEREWRNGRRAGFRCQCPQGRGGSNPPSRTSTIPGLTWAYMESAAGPESPGWHQGGTKLAPTQFGGPGMALIEQRRRADGGLTARVIWRFGGCRDAPREWETFGAGSDAQNLARADGFKRMVEAAGQRLPDGWVKGEGFVRPPDIADPMTPPPSFDQIGEEYVRQIVDLSPGQRKRYLGRLQVVARTPVRGSL